MHASKYFATAPSAHDRVEPFVLAAVRSRKRKQRETREENVEVVDLRNKPPPLSDMEKQVVTLRKTHPDTLLLFECGYRMRIFAQDAENAAAVLGIRAMQHRSFLEASVPVHRTLFHARRLTHAGFKVGVVKQKDSAAMRATNKVPGAKRKPLQRFVAEIYTRATIPECESNGEESDEAEDTRAQFIACVVEATIHAKPFFAQSMQNVDEETKGSQAFAEEVRIGIFVHDVHTGETKFDEFEDDGKRQRLQRALETLDPVEFVLPVGRLSAYTEQIVESFVAAQTGFNAFVDDSELMSCIRVERVSNEYFEFSLAKETFAQVFRDAEVEYEVACPSLPMLCTSCFGGMWQYLSSLGMTKTLITPNYSSLASPAAEFAGQFRLPTEAHRDLDLFVNSTTKRGVGSLFSVLNHTKTNAGARKLRDWIRTPLTCVLDIVERQRTVASLAFPPGSLSTASQPHRIAYEELTTTILPRSKHLLKYLQQIHLGKATPVQAVGALQVLQDIEGHVGALKAMFADHSAACRSSTSEDQPTLLERLLCGYPTLNARLAALFGEIDVKPARRNDVEETIQKLLCRNPSRARKYREFNTELETLARQYDAVLVCCRGVLKSASLEYTVFRGGSLSDIHHLIQVNRADLHVVPRGWLVVNSTKKLVRFHPKEIVQLHVQEEFVKEQKHQLVQATWRQFVGDVDAQAYVMGMKCVDILASLDVLCSLATVAQSYRDYTLPEFVEDDSTRLEIVDGRHPIIETLLEGSSYMSNSVVMSSSAASPGSLLVVSGPNMGGKTSLLRMCALIVILAQIGSFVPAASVRLSVFDGVYTLMHRAATTFNEGASSCSQELAALASISRNASSKSLALIDEVGFGMPVHYVEAMAAAQMRYFVETIGCHVVFATHLTTSIQKLQTRLGDKCQTTQLEYQFQDIVGAANEVAVIFHYELKDGMASDSFAIETARRAGIAADLLERARELGENL
ncbi:hypothetical protein PRNP1_001156 [Phytophthora ramorum]